MLTLLTHDPQQPRSALSGYAWSRDLWSLRYLVSFTEILLTLSPLCVRFVMRLAPLLLVAMTKEIPDFLSSPPNQRKRKLLVASQDENLLSCLTGTAYYYWEAQFRIIYNTLLDVKSLHFLGICVHTLWAQQAHMYTIGKLSFQNSPLFTMLSDIISIHCLNDLYPI